MKKKNILFICLSVILIGICLMFILTIDNKFYLTEESYQDAKLIDISINELNEKLEKKESFALLVYQPACSASSNFCNIIDEFQKDNNLTFYQISYSEIKDDKNFEYLKFYPSFIIYKKGKVIDYLKANKDEDIEKYTNVDSFKNWFNNYVILK